MPLGRPPKNAPKQRRDAVELRELPVITEKIEGRPCWERISGEREKAFAAFQFYRDLGASRTIPDVVKLVRGTLDQKFEVKERLEAIESGRKPENLKRGTAGKRSDSNVLNQLYDWSTRYAWNERCDFYDRHLDQVRIRTAEQNVEKMVERHLTVATSLQTIAKIKLKALEFPAAALTMAPELILRYAVEGTKLERLTLGESTDNTKVQTSAVPAPIEGTANARDEIKRRIDNIRAKKKEREESDTPVTQPGQKPDLRIVAKEA